MTGKFAQIHWMRTEPLEETVSRLARCGYDSLEISGDPNLYDDASQVADLAARYGIDVWGAVTLTSSGARDLIHPDKFVRKAAQLYLQETLEFLSAIGGQVLCCVPSSVGKLSPLDSATSEWRWGVEGLKEAGEYAGAKGLRIAVEPISRFETYFITRSEQAQALVAEVDLPNVGICLDTFHMNIEEVDLPETIRRAGDRLFDFHVADNNRKPPGEGSIDWRAVLGALRDVGYDGCLTAEVDYPRDRSFLADTGDEADGPLTADFYEGIVGTTVRFLRPLVEEYLSTEADVPAT